MGNAKFQKGLIEKFTVRIPILRRSLRNNLFVNHPDPFDPKRQPRLPQQNSIKKPQRNYK